MATAHVLSRRKPATYGKASHKALSHLFTSSNLDPVQRSSQGASFPVENPSHKAEKSRARRSSRLDQQSSPVVARPPNAINQQGARRDYNNQNQIPHPVYDDLQRPMDEDVMIWDISSSDESQSWASHDQSTARKRQKIAPLLRKTSSDLVQLQSTVSKNMGSLPTRKIANQIACQAEPPKLDPHTRSRSVYSHQRVKPNISADGPFRHDQRSHTVISPLPEPQERRDPRRAKFVLSSITCPTTEELPLKLSQTTSPSRKSRNLPSPALKDLEHPTLTPPSTPYTVKSGGSPAKGTTPRQEELWSLLLPKAVTSSCAGDPGAPDLGPASQSSGCQTVDAVVITHSPRRSKKLVDNLHFGKSKRRRRSLSSCAGSIIFNGEQKDATTLGATSPSRAVGDSQPSTIAKGPMPLELEKTLLTEQKVSIPVNGIKATYSTQRSYLANASLNDPNDSSLFDLPLSQERFSSKRTATSKRPQDAARKLDAGSKVDPMKAEVDNIHNSSTRTIHELRESGENVRHLNDTEALFDEIDGHGTISIGLKRERILELLRRMQDPAYCRLLIDQGFETRLLSQATLHDNDYVTNGLVVAAVLHILAAPLGGQTNTQIYSLRAADFLARNLGDDQDMINHARSRRSNLSKRGLLDIKDFINVLSHSSIWRGGTPANLSCRVMGLQGLEYLVRKRREAGCTTEILSPATVQRIVELLPRNPAHSTTPPNADSLFETRLTVSILESSTLGGVKNDDERWTGPALEPLLVLLPWLDNIPVAERVGMEALVLRLYLNLTNNNPRLCRNFARKEVLQAVVDRIDSHFRTMPEHERRMSHMSMLDSLILALGTLINFVEWSQDVRSIMIRDGHFLDTLLTLFLSRREFVAKVYSEEETAFNVAFGYLSILLSELCMEEEARQTVASRLEAGSLQPLLDAVEEFLRYHRQIDEDLGQVEGEVDLKTSFIARLENVVARMGPFV
ncbi:MAG: hypothetical protein LQ350_001125 [Teloschistes chrysophthalmus]|nr:MAG: hypothetical protein LQ350_001125 [Niorma chrysophthalma]